MTETAGIRTRIETEALRLFVVKGVDATSVRDIAGAARCAEGALYRHFPGKSELVAHLFTTHYARMGERLAALAAAERAPKAKLAAMIGGFCAFHDEETILFRFLLFVQHGQLARLDRNLPNPVEAVVRVVREAIAAEAVPRQDPELAAALVLGTVLQPATFAAYGRIPGTLAPLRERLVAAAWAALRAA
jgi:AcrR family transcriptional regulator